MNKNLSNTNEQQHGMISSLDMENKRLRGEVESTKKRIKCTDKECENEKDCGKSHFHKKKKEENCKHWAKKGGCRPKKGTTCQYIHDPALKWTNTGEAASPSVPAKNETQKSLNSPATPCPSLINSPATPTTPATPATPAAPTGQGTPTPSLLAGINPNSPVNMALGGYSTPPYQGQFMPNFNVLQALQAQQNQLQGQQMLQAQQMMQNPLGFQAMGLMGANLAANLSPMSNTQGQATTTPTPTTPTMMETDQKQA